MHCACTGLSHCIWNENDAPQSIYIFIVWGGLGRKDHTRVGWKICIPLSIKIYSGWSELLSNIHKSIRFMRKQREV